MVARPSNMEHERYCARLGICGARDLRDRGAARNPFNLGPNAWCQLPLGHVGRWHSQDPDGQGGYVLFVGDDLILVTRGMAPVWL